MTELRRRMFEELRLRNYSPATIEAYLRCVANFAQHFSAAPDRLGPQHIRQYQLFLVQRKKASWSVFNQTVCALRFFYHHTLHRDWMIEHIPYPRHEQKLPVVLSPAEVAAVFAATRNLKHRTILMTIYAAGLRVSELANLRVADGVAVNIAATIQHIGLLKRRGSGDPNGLPFASLSCWRSS